MTREELIRLHQLLGSLEQMVAGRSPMKWKDDKLTEIRAVEEIVEQLTRTLNPL